MAAFTVNGLPPKAITVSGEACKRVTCSGAEIWKAEKALASSTVLTSTTIGHTAGGTSNTPASSVRWDCSGYNWLTFTLNTTNASNCEAQDFKVYVKAADGTTVATVWDSAAYGSASTACEVDLRGLTEANRNGLYLSAYMYGYKAEWSGFVCSYSAQAVSVTATL